LVRILSSPDHPGLAVWSPSLLLHRRRGSRAYSDGLDRNRWLRSRPRLKYFAGPIFMATIIGIEKLLRLTFDLAQGPVSFTGQALNRLSSIGGPCSSLPLKVLNGMLDVGGTTFCGGAIYRRLGRRAPDEGSDALCGSDGASGPCLAYFIIKCDPAKIGKMVGGMDVDEAIQESTN
jgi:hypothetical protein